MRRFWATCVVTAGVLFGGCVARKDTGYIGNEGSIFHTSYHIRYRHAEDLGRQIDSVLEVFDASLNPFRENSLIARINRGETQETDTLLREVVGEAAKISRETDGAFDITCAPLVNLWGFGYNDNLRHDSATIDSVRQFVGYEKIRIENGNFVKDDPRVEITLSAIAKGQAVDVVGRWLESRGITDYMVEIGGEVRVRGKNPSGEAWRIGVDRPIESRTRNAGEDVQLVVGLKDCAVATSGNYRNYHEVDGRRVGHTIDPKTGYPKYDGLLSTTVVTRDCMTADGYATALMSMGKARAMAFASQREDMAVFLIFADGDEMVGWMSERFEALVVED